MESLNQSLNTSLHIECEPMELLIGLNYEDHEVNGMENSSNNCYLNAIVQCAKIHINSLYDFLTSKNQQLLEIIDGDSSLILLYNFVVSYCHLVMSNDHDEHLPAFIKSLSKLTPNFELNVQHDSNELWLFITEQIDKLIQVMNNEQAPIKDKNPNDLFKLKFKKKISCRQILCTKKHESDEYEHSLCLNINRNFDNSLHEYLHEKCEILYKCPTTNRSNNIEIEREIIKSPDYLIIQLKRFNYDVSTKTSSKSREYFNVNVDLNFDKKAYTLIAVCLHKGISLENGHYISYIKKGDDWYECDDKRINMVNKTYDIDTFVRLDCKNKNIDPVIKLTKSTTIDGIQEAKDNKKNLLELNRAKIDEKQDKSENRVYIIDKKYEYPSVTTVLKRISDSKYQYAHKNKKFDSEKSKQEGTDFHQYCQNYLEGNSNYEKYVPTERRDMLKCFMKELDKIKPLKTECVLYSHERKYAGRADVIGHYEKKLCLIDFKFTRTTNNKSESDYELAFLQTAAYALAYHEMTGSEIHVW